MPARRPGQVTCYTHLKRLKKAKLTGVAVRNTKRPNHKTISAFVLFMAERGRGGVEGGTYRERLRRAGALWRGMNAQEKRPYLERAAVIRGKHTILGI